MIQPKGKQVIIRPDAIPDTYDNGIIRSSKPVSNTGEVVAVSPDYEFPFKVGSWVQYMPNHQEVLENGDVLIRGDEEGSILFAFND